MTEEETFFEALLTNPKQMYYGFKLANIYVCRYTPTEEQIKQLEDAGVHIDPWVCVRNYRHSTVEYLLRERRINPDDHIHDICLTPYHRDRPDDFLLTLKLLIDYGANLEGLDSQDRTPLECLKTNRPLKWIGEPYIRKILNDRKKTILESKKTKMNKYIVD